MALYGTVSTNVNADDIAALAEGGISAFKLSTYEVSADRFPRFGPPLFLAAFREIAKTGLPVAIHNEDQELVNDLVAKAIAAGKTDAIMHCRTRPPLSETLANLEVFELGLETGAHVHIAHSSVARGFDMAEWYRGQGGNATAETCLHYLAMTEDDVVRLKGFAKCNPPLRPAAEVEAVWERVIAGKAAYVSSDHAPWQPARKGSANIFDNASGLTGLQSFAPVMFSMLTKRGLPLTMLALLCSERSARFHGLYPRKGAIEPGADCDLMVLEPGDFSFDEAVIVDADEFRWSPFNGRPVKARVAGTVLRGRIVFDGETVLAQPGSGRFVNRRKVAAQAVEQNA
jgi:allantoinase